MPPFLASRIIFYFTLTKSEGQQLPTKGKFKVRTRLKISSVEDLTLALAAGGGSINKFGDLELKIRKGLLSREYKTYIVEYGFIKGVKTAGAFFAVRLKENITPVLTVHFQPVKEDILLGQWICHDSNYRKMCKELLNILKSGLEKAKPPEIEAHKPSATHGFRVGYSYAHLLDGMAEVTLATALLKYPLINRMTYNVEVIKDLDEFLKMMTRKLSKGRYIITVTGKDWRFIIGLNTETLEYTPSFISWKTNERLLGEEALKRLQKINSSEEVQVLVFEVPSSN